MATLKRFFDSIEFSWKDAIWWGLAIGAFIGLKMVGAEGGEWYTYYRAIPNGFQNMPEVANPPYTAVLLYPLMLFPVEVGAQVFTIVNILAVFLASRLVGGNRWGVLLSFPFTWLMWYAQLDGLVALGIGLGYWAVKTHRPLWVGIACVLLGIKPQVGSIVALYYLWCIKDIKALICPFAVLALSILLFGFWPVAYAQRLVGSSDAAFFTEQLSNIGLFPWGMLSLLLLLLRSDSMRQRIIIILGATMLSSPYTAYYGTLSLIIFSLPWWSYVFFSAPFFLPAHLDAAGVTLGLVLLMIFYVVRSLIIKRDRRSEDNETQLA